MGHLAFVFNKRSACSACRFLVEKPEEKGAFGKCKLMWEGNVEIYHKEVGGEGIHWIYMAGDRNKCQAVCEHGNKLWGCHKIWGISGLNEGKLYSEEEFCSLELVGCLVGVYL